MEDTQKGWIVGTIQLAFVVTVVAVALFITNLLSPAEGSSSAIPQASADIGVDINVVQPIIDQFTPEIRLNGVIQTQTQTNIAPQIGGRVVYVSPNFRPGAAVTKGERLFQIETADFELAVEQAQANIDSASSDLALLEAEAELARQEWLELFPGQPITDLAARKPQIAAAKSRLASAEAAKKTAALALSRTRIVAPSDARVLSTQLDVGQVVAPNVAVGSIYALDSVEISAPLSTRQLETLQPVINRKASIQSNERADIVIEGTIKRQNATLDPRTRLATVFITPNTLEGLTIGDFATVVLKADPVQRAMTVPATSFFGRDEVWVVVDGVLQRRSLTRLGERGDDVFVRAFDFGEGVVTLPPVEGYDGMKVSKRVLIEERQLAGGRNAG